MSVIDNLKELRDHTFQVAILSLEENNTRVYRTLTEIAEKISALLNQSSISPVETSTTSENVNIFARYKGKKYEAIIDLGSIEGGRGKCILMDNRWWTASGAAREITHTSVNGWRYFWKYEKAGEIIPIEKLKK